MCVERDQFSTLEVRLFKLTAWCKNRILTRINVPDYIPGWPATCLSLLLAAGLLLVYLPYQLANKVVGAYFWLHFSKLLVLSSPPGRCQGINHGSLLPVRWGSVLPNSHDKTCQVRGKLLARTLYFGAEKNHIVHAKYTYMKTIIWYYYHNNYNPQREDFKKLYSHL